MRREQPYPAFGPNKGTRFEVKRTALLCSVLLFVVAALRRSYREATWISPRSIRNV
jgi:hypothetical protein